MKQSWSDSYITRLMLRIIDPNDLFSLQLDDVALSPNRVFLLSCPESVSTDRLSVKRNEVMSRVVPNHPLFYKNPKVLEFGGEGDGPSESFGQNPYDEAVVKTRMEHYNQNLPGVLRHYGQPKRQYNKFTN